MKGICCYWRFKLKTNFIYRYTYLVITNFQVLEQEEDCFSVNLSVVLKFESSITEDHYQNSCLIFTNIDSSYVWSTQNFICGGGGGLSVEHLRRTFYYLLSYRPTNFSIY
jgi:hypothetical protein